MEPSKPIPYLNGLLPVNSLVVLQTNPPATVVSAPSFSSIFWATVIIVISLFIFLDRATVFSWSLLALSPPEAMTVRSPRIKAKTWSRVLSTESPTTGRK